MSRRIRFTLISISLISLLIAGICVAIFLSPRDDNRIRLSGAVVLRDSYILSSCLLPNGESCIWSYDFNAEEFKTHARRKDGVDVLPGSTREEISWHEYRAAKPFALQKVVTMRGGSTEPRELDLAKITGFPIGTTASFYFVEQARNSSTTLQVSSAFNLPFTPLAWSLIDLESGKEVGKLPSTNTPTPRGCYLGKSKEYFAFYDMNAKFAGEIVILDAKSVKELLRHPLKRASMASDIHAISDLEFIVEDAFTRFTRCRLTQLDDGLSIEMIEEVEFPEPVWKPNFVTGIQNMYAELVATGVSGFPPSWDPDELNMPTCHLRNGLVAWELVNPRVIRIAKAKDPSNRVEIALSLPGVWEWQFQLSDDASVLVTRSAADTFQIWRINFPNIELWQECLLEYNAATNSLTLEQVQLPQSAA